MKKSLMTASVAAAMMFGQSMPAQAINKEWSAVAGFVGGVLVANAVNCGPRTTYYQPAPVVYQAPTVVVHEPPPRIVRYERPSRPSGYYEYRSERVWVPGRWVYEDLGCGRERKVWEPGYYETVQNKVWVSHRRGGCDW